MDKCTVLEAELFEDHRGTIRSFYPDENIVEYNLMITKQGDARGYHYHPHFTEYMVIVDGECLFKEYSDNVHEIVLTTGDSIRIPIGTAHTFIALTDFKFVSMLTKRWHDSNPPIVKVDENGKSI
jgi:quercetin dioxygenase-like cupin family protein|tara:strand:- start:441 stop:815 length:375 start_codon:yes stop_codon:yes gene_type:complete